MNNILCDFRGIIENSIDFTNTTIYNGSKKNLMKKIFIIIIICLVLLNSYCYATDFETQAKNFTIKMAGDNHLPPYQYVNDNGIYKGFCIDIAHAIAIEMGLDIELIPLPFFSLNENIDKGYVDLILGLEEKDEYDSDFIFSVPYLNISNGLFVQKDNNYIVNIEDIRNTRVAVQRGNRIHDSILKDVENVEIVYVDNQQQGILQLMMGSVDVFIGNRLTGLYTVQKWGQTDFIKVVGNPIEPINYCFATKPENSDLIKIMNEGIGKIRLNGIYEKIYAKWFGEIVISPRELKEKYFKKTVIIMSVFFLVILLIVRINRTLKNQVYNKTRELTESNTKLVKLNKALDSEYKFNQNIIENVFHGVIILDIHYNIIFMNRNAIGILNIDSNTENKKITDTELISIISMEEVNDALHNSIKVDEKTIQVCIEGRKKYFLYSINYLSRRENSKEVLILIKDITKNRLMQEKLIQKDKMQTLGQFMSIMAHEIRNPLTIIKNYIDLIPEKLGDERFLRSLEKYVPPEVNRINKLVSELLNYSNPKTLEKKKVKIKELVEDVILILKKTIEEKQVKIIIKEEYKAIINVDRQKIKQVLLNIFTNSIHAVKKNEGKIIVTIKERNSNTVISIKDNGYGIDSVDIDRIFEPFYTNKENGTGLGLAVCYQIMKEHEGELIISSRKNEWTLVELLF